MLPMGMSPTSWIFKVFCRGRGEQSQRLAVTPKHTQGQGWHIPALGEHFPQLIKCPKCPGNKAQAPEFTAQTWPRYLQELVEVRDLQEREAGNVLDQLLDFGGVLFGGVI